MNPAAQTSRQVVDGAVGKCLQAARHRATNQRIELRAMPEPDSGLDGLQLFGAQAPARSAAILENVLF